MAAELGLVELGWITPIPWTTSLLATALFARVECGARTGHESESESSLLPDEGKISEGESSTEECIPQQAQPDPLADQQRGSVKAKQDISGVRKAVIFACVSLDTFLVWAAISTMMPFLSPATLQKFPGDAVEKQTAIGFIFGIATYVEFIAGPLVAKDLHNAGSKLVLVLSAFETAAMNFLFSFVIRIDDWTLYVVLCLAIRSVQGIATAANLISATSIILGAFPDAGGIVNGVFRCCCGLGYAIGPVIGGVLYDYGGFALPFYVCSGALLACTVVLVIFLPSKEDHLSTVSLEASISFGKLLSFPWIWVTLISVFLINNSMGFVEPPLPLYFKEAFNAKPVFSGIAFLLYGAVYSVLAPTSGYLIDHWKVSPRFLIMLAVFWAGVLCQLVGPASFLPIPRSLGLSLFAMAGFGISNSLCLTGAMPDLLQTYEDNAIPNPLSLRAVVAGIYQAAMSVGYGTGPILGSSISAVLGFQDGISALGGVYFVWLTIVLAGWLYSHWRKKRESSKSTPGFHYEETLPMVENSSW